MDEDWETQVSEVFDLYLLSFDVQLQGSQESCRQLWRNLAQRKKEKWPAARLCCLNMLRWPLQRSRLIRRLWILYNLSQSLTIRALVGWRSTKPNFQNSGIECNLDAFFWCDYSEFQLFVLFKLFTYLFLNLWVFYFNIVQLSVHECAMVARHCHPVNNNHSDERSTSQIVADQYSEQLFYEIFVFIRFLLVSNIWFVRVYHGRHAAW